MATSGKCLACIGNLGADSPFFKSFFKFLLFGESRPRHRRRTGVPELFDDFCRVNAANFQMSAAIYFCRSVKIQVLPPFCKKTPLLPSVSGIFFPSLQCLTGSNGRIGVCPVFQCMFLKFFTFNKPFQKIRALPGKLKTQFPSRRQSLLIK